MIKNNYLAQISRSKNLTNDQTSKFYKASFYKKKKKEKNEAKLGFQIKCSL